MKKEKDELFDREKAQGSAYDKLYFTDEQLKQGEEVNKRAAAGDITWDSAHNWWENTRAGYGYTGGEDGHGYTALQKSYGEAPSYTNKYQNAINAVENAIMNRGAFTYDPNKDPAYQQYADSYTRQGQQAMQDTLAQVSARTGGLASSYAASASQQAYNNYMSALADKVPELRQLAYQMYLNEGDDLRQNMQMLQGLEQTDYDRYLNSLDQYNANRNFEYGRERDRVGDQQWQSKFDYEKGQDDKNWELKSRQDAQAQVQDHIAAGGKAGDLPEELITASGYSPALLAAWEKVYADEQNAPKVTDGGGGNPKQSSDYGTAAKFAANKLKSDGMEAAVAYLNGLVDNGYLSEDEAVRIYTVELGGSGDSMDIVPTSYEEFVAKTGNSSIATRREFGRIKERDMYDSYEDYLARMYEKYTQ